MISVKNLEKIYSDDGSETMALRNVSFNIKKGEFVSVMGPSGSGKSTLLHLLSFLDRPTNGSYKFFDKDTDKLTDTELAQIRNKEVGFVFQSFNLLSRSSVYENVEIPLIYSKGVPASHRKKLVESAVEAVGLKEKLMMETGRLSGGQKQRVAIARALVNDPNVIFADEPTGNLDSKSGAQIMEILEALHNAGRTIILVTHETYTAEFADRLIRLKDGSVESDEPTGKKHRHGKEFFK
ncbi:MAG: ABC transporter ATP-binding protein [Candidatus Liptonbacteria bacterium]|nr:ABC transporter ATP-binding protein [Candidatus Liptonbacteria bacterium]